MCLVAHGVTLIELKKQQNQQLGLVKEELKSKI